jgi:polysaccharide pyruvyl transferase WcaK-like protein
MWPSSDPGLYDRYLNELANVLNDLLERNHFLLFVWSARGDQNVVQELLARGDDNFKARLLQNSYFATPSTWKDYLSIVQVADLLIASRLHSIILGFLAKVPVLAISFDPKVDWVMQDVEQDGALLQIRNFTAREVVQACERLDFRKKEIVQHLTCYHQQVVETSALQYDTIARMALAHAGRRVTALAGN